MQPASNLDLNPIIKRDETPLYFLSASGRCYHVTVLHNALPVRRRFVTTYTRRLIRTWDRCVRQHVTKHFSYRECVKRLSTSTRIFFNSVFRPLKKRLKYFRIRFRFCHEIRTQTSKFQILLRYVV